MKFILRWSKWSVLKLDLSFSPQLIFSGNNVLALVPPWTCAPQLMPKKNKLRMANAVNNLFMALAQLWVLCTLTHGKSMSWGWLLWGMLWKLGLKEQRERKNKSKVTQELFEKKEIFKNYKQKIRKESLTQMKKEGKQQGERIGETGRNKVI